MPVPQQSHFNRPVRFLRKSTGKGSRYVALRLPREIEADIEKIKAAFAERWPSDKYPTLSAALQLCIDRSIRQFVQNPKVLKEEVVTFQRRYSKQTNRRLEP